MSEHLGRPGQEAPYLLAGAGGRRTGGQEAATLAPLGPALGLSTVSSSLSREKVAVTRPRGGDWTLRWSGTWRGGGQDWYLVDSTLPLVGPRYCTVLYLQVLYCTVPWGAGGPRCHHYAELSRARQPAVWGVGHQCSRQQVSTSSTLSTINYPPCTTSSLRLDN